MDFELKTLTRARICAEKTDALLVLVPQEPGTGNDPLSALTALAVKSGDFEAKPGKLLAAYRAPGIAATRLVLAGVGDASPKNIRAAVAAALGAVKNGNTQGIVLCLDLLDALQADAVRAAQLAERMALSQYRAGTATYLSVVTAQTLSLTNQRTAAQVLGRQLAASVSLIAATGGGWNAATATAAADAAPKTSGN